MNVVELNPDATRVICHHVGGKLFSLNPALPAEPPQDLLTVKVAPEDSQEYDSMEIDWPNATGDLFKPRTAYGIYHPDIGKHALIMSQFRLYKQALKDLVAMTATCRAWSTLLVSHWHSIYRTMEKFLPFVLCGEKNRRVRAIAMPASPQVLPRLSDAWCRLALKYVCKNGQKMANRAITRQRYVYNPQRTRGFKPATLYLARSRQTQVTAIKLGKDIDPDEDVVEYTLTEKIVDGHAYWRHKTMADVDAALDRRSQILTDTHALQNELEKEAHGPLFFGMREL